MLVDHIPVGRGHTRVTKRARKYESPPILCFLLILGTVKLIDMVEATCWIVLIRHFLVPTEIVNVMAKWAKTKHFCVLEISLGTSCCLDYRTIDR